MKKSIRWSEHDSEIFLLLHIVAFIVVFYFISSSSGCGAEDDPLGGHDLGPEVSQADVLNTYIDVMKSKHPLDLQVGNATLYEGNQRVGVGPIIKSYDDYREITSMKIEDSVLTIQLIEKITEYDTNGNVINPSDPFVPRPIIIDLQPNNNLSLTDLQIHDSTSKLLVDQFNKYIFKISRAKSETADLSWQNYAKSKLGLRSSSLSIGQSISTFDSTILKTTFHDLKYDDSYTNAPKAVANKPDCQGLVNCQLKVRNISFVVANWTSATDWEKILVKWTLSAEVPGFLGAIEEGFGGIVNQCISQIVSSTNNEQIFATACPQVLRDYN